MNAPQANPAKSFDISVTTRASKCGGRPAVTWLAQIWIVAGQLEIDIFKNGHEWAPSVQPSEVLPSLRCAGSHKSHPYVARKITALARTVAKIHGL